MGGKAGGSALPPGKGSGRLLGRGAADLGGSWGPAAVLWWAAVGCFRPRNAAACSRRRAAGTEACCQRSRRSSTWMVKPAMAALSAACPCFTVSRVSLRSVVVSGGAADTRPNLALAPPWHHRGRHGAAFLPLPASGAQEGERKRVEMPRCPPGRRLAGVRVTQGVQRGPEKQGPGTTTWLMPGKCLLGTWQLSAPEVLSAHFWVRV